MKAGFVSVTLLGLFCWVNAVPLEQRIDVGKIAAIALKFQTFMSELRELGLSDEVKNQIRSAAENGGKCFQNDLEEKLQPEMKEIESVLKDVMKDSDDGGDSGDGKENEVSTTFSADTILKFISKYQTIIEDPRLQEVWGKIKTDAKAAFKVGVTCFQDDLKQNMPPEDFTKLKALLDKTFGTSQ